MQLNSYKCSTLFYGCSISSFKQILFLYSLGYLPHRIDNLYLYCFVYDLFHGQMWTIFSHLWSYTPPVTTIDDAHALLYYMYEMFAWPFSLYYERRVYKKNNSVHQNLLLQYTISRVTIWSLLFGDEWMVARIVYIFYVLDLT